jgi:hypothetical protein
VTDMEGLGGCRCPPLTASGSYLTQSCVGRRLNVQSGPSKPSKYLVVRPELHRRSWEAGGASMKAVVRKVIGGSLRGAGVRPSHA